MRIAVENGLVWRFSAEFSVAAGATYYIGFTTGSSTVAIESRDIASTRDDTLVLLYEDVSYSGGSAAALQNRNRLKQSDSSLNPLAEIKNNVTATPAGVPVTGAHMLFGNNGGSVGIPSDPDSNVILLKPNTSHILSILNGDVLTATVGIGAVFRRDIFVA